MHALSKTNLFDPDPPEPLLQEAVDAVSPLVLGVHAHVPLVGLGRDAVVPHGRVAFVVLFQDSDS